MPNARQIYRLRKGVLAASIAAAAIAVSPSTASAAPLAISGNWSGYIASGSNFSSVAGSWVQPALSCSSGSSYSAYWVGLGGDSGQTNALEQAGTQSDCSTSGQAYYYAWYELVPAGPATLNLPIKPGDRISARVTVNGSAVTVWLADQTSGQSVTRTVQMSAPDTSTAEWIAEAPSACDQTGSCQPLPLASFGTVSFTNASATANGHTGPISDPAWTAQPVALSPDASGAVSYSQTGAVGAEPSQLSSDGTSFSITSAAGGGTSAASSGDPGAGYYYGAGGGPGAGYYYSWGSGDGYPY
ncbi:MAG: G1 family endopeptidase [Actinomycetota bacterium]|nr:G1 family endopeptidase [Actinomycetota bacterium]